MSEFTDWLNEQLTDRDWSFRKLARRAQVTHAAISHVINETRQPGVDLCRSIARAFELPPEVVFRRAGLLPPASPVDEEVEELLFWYDQLSPRQQRQIRAMVKAAAKDAQRFAKGTAEPGEPSSPA